MSEVTPIPDLVRDGVRLLGRKKTAELLQVAPGTVERIELGATTHHKGTMALMEANRPALAQAIEAAAKAAEGKDQPKVSAA
ncbi:MAG: hypothetical protein EKK55_18110 [Rhodocyclaceae bacterium]|nr:MAG: hypothetical protein EKK55_18110 [Rhodocyclaceae bacterium]